MASAWGSNDAWWSCLRVQYALQSLNCPCRALCILRRLIEPKPIHYFDNGVLFDVLEQAVVRSIPVKDISQELVVTTRSKVGERNEVHCRYAESHLGPIDD